MNYWTVIARERDLSQKRPLQLRRFGRNWVLWRTGEGTLSLLLDQCPHRSASLALGEITNHCLRCPFHGFEFDSSGACKHIPETPNRSDLSGYNTHGLPVQSAHGWIWAWVGSVPPTQTQVPWFEAVQSNFTFSEIVSQWRTHMSRAVENQLDFAHLPFVHRTTIGRFSNLSRQPLFQLHDERLRICPNQEKLDQYIEFAFSNIWINHISSKYMIVVAFVPVDEDHTIMYLRQYQGFVKIFGISQLIDWINGFFSSIVLKQDQKIVESQSPKNVLSTDLKEVLTGSDRGISHYRKRLLEWEKQLHPLCKP